MKGKTLLTLALALTMTLSLAACSSGGSASVPAPDASAPMAAAPESALTPKLVEDGVLKVAMECAYAPFNWTQADDSNGAVPISGHLRLRLRLRRHVRQEDRRASGL